MTETGGDGGMAEDLNSREEKLRRKSIEQTEYFFLLNELKNKLVEYPDDYRKYLENRVEELRKKYDPEYIRRNGLDGKN